MTLCSSSLVATRMSQRWERIRTQQQRTETESRFCQEPNRQVFLECSAPCLLWTSTMAGEEEAVQRKHGTEHSRKTWQEPTSHGKRLNTLRRMVLSGFLRVSLQLHKWGEDEAPQAPRSSAAGARSEAPKVPRGDRDILNGAVYFSFETS